MTPEEQQGESTEESKAKQDVAPPENRAPEAPRDDLPPAEAVPAAEKLDDPATVGKMTTDPAASTGKPADAQATAAAPPDAPAAQAEPAKPERAAKAAPAERPARPAREAEPKEAPRVAPPAGSVNEILAQAAPGVTLKAAYVVPFVPGDSVAVEVAPADVPAVLTACRDDARLDLKYLRSLAGVDWQEEGLEVVYHLASLTKPHTLTVKTRVTLEEPVVPSVTALFPSADWHERETRDMFGIHFEGHPNLVPLLLPDDMTDHFPLRKDNPLQEIEEWQGENLREGAEGDEE